MGDDFDPFGMGPIDGGKDRWDMDHDGKLDLLETNRRLEFDREMMENLEEGQTTGNRRNPGGSGLTPAVKWFWIAWLIVMLLLLLANCS